MIPSYPLRWPDHQKRTDSWLRKTGRFQVGFRRALDDLREAMEQSGVVRDDYSLTTMLPTRGNGDPYGTGRNVGDPGAALWWREKGKMRVLACDQFFDVAHNMRAIGLAIGNLRDLKRWGVSQIVDTMLDGFALPPGSGVEENAGTGPIAQPIEPDRSWMDVFHVSEAASREGVEAMYKTLARQHHPDRGGDTSTMTQLNVAWQNAQKWFDWRDKFKR